MNKTTKSLAIKALEMIAGERMCINNLLSDKDIAREAIAAIRAEALAEPVKQEPVAIVVEVDRHGDATVVSGAWQLDGGKHTFYGAPVSVEAIRAEALEQAAAMGEESIRIWGDEDGRMVEVVSAIRRLK